MSNSIRKLERVRAQLWGIREDPGRLRIRPTSVVRGRAFFMDLPNLGSPRKGTTMSKLQFWMAHFAAFRWTWRRTPNRYRPLLRAEFCAGDQFAEAVFLLNAGYRSAAVATSRTAVERLLKRVALMCPNWRSLRRPQFERLAKFLLNEGIISEDEKRQFNSFGERAGCVVHGGDCTMQKAARLVAQGESLRKILLPALYNLVCSQPDGNHEKATGEWVKLSKNRIADLDLPPVVGSVMEGGLA